MINRVVLVGRLTRDPELRTVGANNSKVCSFTLAVDSRFRGKMVSKPQILSLRSLESS